MIWDNKTKDYWEFIAYRDRHSMTVQIHDLEIFDEVKQRELFEDLIEYIRGSLGKVKKCTA